MSDGPLPQLPPGHFAQEGTTNGKGRVTTQLGVTEGRGKSDAGEADMKTVGRPVELGWGRTHVEVEWTELIWNLGTGINNCWAKDGWGGWVSNAFRWASSTDCPTCLHTYMHTQMDTSIAQCFFSTLETFWSIAHRVLKHRSWQHWSCCSINLVHFIWKSRTLHRSYWDKSGFNFTTILNSDKAKYWEKMLLLSFCSVTYDFFFSKEKWNKKIPSDWMN